MVCDIILFLTGQNLLALHILALYLVKQIGVGAGSQIVQHRLRGDRSVFVFEKLRDGCGGEGGAHVGHDIGDDALQQVHVPNLIAFDDVFELHGVEYIG